MFRRPAAGATAFGVSLTSADAVRADEPARREARADACAGGRLPVDGAG
jgi:hypothetical protein